MMYIILLIYFVNIVTGDDSSEAKYIDLLPEKEKEDFLETVARRIFDNFKHKNTIPEKDEHTKLIEKVLKEESLNLKRVFQNTSDNNDGKGNKVEEGVDALDLTQEGKRNKRNSLKETKNSDIVRVQQASEQTNISDFNELSKELGVSDTEDIEVKHTNNKQIEANNEAITTESNVEGIRTEITAGDLISKEDSSVHDEKSNYEQKEKTTKSPSSTSKPEEIRDINEEGSESIRSAKTTDYSYSPTEKINVISRRNVNSEPTNDSSEKDTTTKPEEKNEAFPRATTIIVTASPEIKTAKTTTELSKINETRKSYDKLTSDSDTDNITLGDIRDDRDNEGTKAVIDDKRLPIKSVVTAGFKLDNNYFNDENTATAADKNQNQTSLNDLAISIKENYNTVAQNIKSLNSVTPSEYKDIKSSETIVKDTDNSNKTIIKVIKNSKDYIKKKHSANETAVHEYSGTTLENNINSMTKNSNIIDKRGPEIITTTAMSTLINNNKEIFIENSKENTQNKSDGITNGIHVDATMKSNKMKNGPENAKITGKEILIDESKEIKMQDNRAAGQDINQNKTDTNYEEVITETINIAIKHGNSAGKNKFNSSEVGSDTNIIENNEGTIFKTYIETTTVKIETLTVATDINKPEANDTDFKIKEDDKPYMNQEKKTKTPTTNPEAIFVTDDNKMKKNLEKMDNISANFVNDMIKAIRASFSDKPNEDGTLRSLDNNPKPKEYKVEYKAPKNEPLGQDEAKDDKAIEENPYYVPVYNYGPEHAYYNPKNRLGPNSDDGDVTIIKNEGYNVESIAHDYDSIVKDNGYIENDDTENYQNRQDAYDYDARNDVDYDEAYNKEKEFIDRMGDRNYIFTRNENLRGRNTANTNKLNKVEYMKHLVKIYKNSNNKNRNRQRSLGKYKLNLPIVVNYPKYSDIIMNSHDYLDVDYRYPTRYKPKQVKNLKHRILRTRYGNSFPKDLIITSFADEPDFEQDNTVGLANPYSEGTYNDDSNMLPHETQNQETEKPYKIIYDDDYESYVKKPLENHYGKSNSINLFESGEYIWETQDTKEKRNKQKNEDEKSLGVKNQIRKIREMMYNAANFGFIKSKEVEEINYHGLKDFIKEVPKMCDGEDLSCVEPYILISNSHIYNRKQTDSGRHAMNNSIARNYFMARANNSSDFVVDYVPKLAARTNKFKFGSSVKTIDQFQITWIPDLSQLQDEGDKSDCSFCSHNVCHTCLCGTYNKFCKIPETKPSDGENNKDNEVELTIQTDDKESTETTKDDDIPNTTDSFYWDTVKNVSMLPSYLDPILKNNNENRQKKRLKKTYIKKLTFRSRSDKLRPKNSLRNDSPEDNYTEPHVEKPNIIKLNSPDELAELTTDNPNLQEAIETSDTKTDEAPKKKQKIKYNKINTLKSIMEIIPDDVELMLKVTAMLENVNGVENEYAVGEKGFLRNVESIDLESYATVLQDMVRNEAKGLVQYDWMGTSIDIQAAVFKLKEMTESVKNNEVLDDLDFKLLKYFTFLHKFSMKRQKDLRMVLPKPKYKYNKTPSQRGIYSRTWLKRRLKKFAFEVSGTDLYYFMEFLEELQFYLYDLHTALTQIASVTSYNNQHWFKNLADLYLDNSRKNILELLLHVTTVRLLDLIENSVQTGLQDGFLKYVMTNEKKIEKSKNEFVLILRIIEELNKMA